MMDSLALRPDPMDYQIIQFSNACQILSCFCNIAAICVAELRDLAALIDLVADIITFSVAGCMGAQIHHQLTHSTAGSATPGAPTPQGMNRDAGFTNIRTAQQHTQPMQPAYGQPAMAIAQPAPQMFMVQVPQGVGPGQQMMVVSPSGQQMMVQVPQGVGPGMSFQCQM